MTREIIKNTIYLLKQTICQYWIILAGTFFGSGILLFLIRIYIDDLIASILKKAGGYMLKLIRPLEKIKAHPALVPISLFCCVFAILGVITYIETPETPVETTPIPTLTSEQQVEKNLELLETYLNGGECKTAFDELFTERFRINWLYTGFCELDSSLKCNRGLLRIP